MNDLVKIGEKDSSVTTNIFEAARSLLSYNQR